MRSFVIRKLDLALRGCVGAELRMTRQDNQKLRAPSQTKREVQKGLPFLRAIPNIKA